MPTKYNQCVWEAIAGHLLC